MRITDNMRLLGLTRANQIAQQRIDSASRRAAAGARVTAPSDDPVAYATVVRRTSSIAQHTAATRAAREGADELSFAERALDAGSTMVEEALSLAVQGANETMSQTDRDALAVRVTGLRDQLLGVANTKSTRGYVFAGTRTDTAPFDASGAFRGNDGVVRVPVGDGVAPRGNVSGARAFTAAGGRDVFADLASLATALSSGNVAGIRASIDALGASHAQILDVQVEAGLSIERLTSAADVLDSATVTLTASRTRASGGDDLAGLATDLSSASSAYERSLDATRKLLALPSLTS